MADKIPDGDWLSKEELERIMNEPPNLPVPAWLAAYQCRFPNLDFSRYSLDRIMCIREYLIWRFREAARLKDEDLLSDPDVADAIWLIYDEPTRFVPAMFQWRRRKARYGGDFEADFQRIKKDLECLFFKGHNCEAMARWFNLIFYFVGSAIASWVACTNKLDTSPLFAALKNRIASLPITSEGPQFPEPYGMKESLDDLKVEPDLSKQLLDLYGVGGVKCVDPALGQLVLLARGECSRPRPDVRTEGESPQTAEDEVGEWASQWVSDYDPVHCTLKFLDIPLDFSRSPRRWEHVKAVVESKERDGAVRLGDWMGRWQTASGPVRYFSRCIRQPDRAESGWYHLTDTPRPESPTRQKCKRFAQRGG